MKKIRLALLGAGERGYACYGPYLRLHGFEIEMTAVAEPDAARRSRFATAFNVPRENVFADADEFLKREKLADGVMICTQDRHHFGQAMAAIGKGYAVLLEKPVSSEPAECLQMLEAADKNGSIVMVCHVLRYMRFFKTIKSMLDGGAVGDIVSMTYAVNIGYWHYAHSFVRGNWSRISESGPLSLTKTSHDMDMLIWLTGSKCASVSSHGGLSHFTAKNAPPGAASRCLDGCPHASVCNYYAPSVYLTGNTGWPVSAISADTSYDAVLEALKHGPYGRCVYRCDNDAADHQIASLFFENGITVAFSISALTNDDTRALRIMGNKGEIRADLDKGEIELTAFAPGIMTGTKNRIAFSKQGIGHSEGDFGIIGDFVAVMRRECENSNPLETAVHGHMMAFAAEESRIRGEKINISEWQMKLSGKRNG